jgi:5-methylcytosine-specific restriction endonuclease McrA
MTLEDLAKPRLCKSGRHTFTGKQCMECQRLWVKVNPERKREADRKYYLAHRSGDARRAAWKKWNSSDGKRATQRKYQAANRAAYAMKEHRRRARKAANVTDLTTSEWQAILDFHGSPEGTRCAYCFGVCKKVTVDHVVPISKGGGHTVANVVPACLPCNRKKGVKEAAF